MSNAQRCVKGSCDPAREMKYAGLHVLLLEKVSSGVCPNLHVKPSRDYPASRMGVEKQKQCSKRI